MLQFLTQTQLEKHLFLNPLELRTRFWHMLGHRLLSETMLQKNLFQRILLYRQ